MLMVDPQSQINHRKKANNGFSHLDSSLFNLYSSRFGCSSSTTKEQVMDFMAHMFLMIQLSRGLGATTGSNMTKIFKSGHRQLKKFESLGS